MTAANTKLLEEMTVPELRSRAKELGIESSDVEPIEASGDVPVRADWLREVRKAEGSAPALKEEWRAAGTDLVTLFREEGDPNPEVRRAQEALATKLADGTPTNADLIGLRDAVNSMAAKLREAERREVADRFSEANYFVRRAGRATRVR